MPETDAAVVLLVAARDPNLLAKFCTANAITDLYNQIYGCYKALFARDYTCSTSTSDMLKAPSCTNSISNTMDILSFTLANYCPFPTIPRLADEYTLCMSIVIFKF